MKIIRIETCGDCPYCSFMRCGRLNIGCAVNGVLDDCPLEDAPEVITNMNCKVCKYWERKEGFNGHLTIGTCKCGEDTDEGYVCDLFARKHLTINIV